MPNIEIPFEPNKQVWHICSSRISDTIQCDDCLGTGIIHVTMGSGTIHAVACEECNTRGSYPHSTGRVPTWITQYEVEEYTPKNLYDFQDGIARYQGCNYNTSGGTIVSSKDLFATKEEADVECQKRNIASRIYTEKSCYDNVVDKVKKYAWSASYHRNNIKRLEKDISYHQKRLNEISVKEKKRD